MLAITAISSALDRARTGRVRRRWTSRKPSRPRSASSPKIMWDWSRLSRTRDLSERHQLARLARLPSLWALLPAVMAAEVERRECGAGDGSRASAPWPRCWATWALRDVHGVSILTRTFLTLEGIANQVDPAFNVYEVALPWAVRRALAPSTVKGAATLRSSILTTTARSSGDASMT